MKNLLPAASALTLGVAGLAVSTTAASAKPWTLTAGLSGFYNDNIYTRSDIPKQSSFGFEVNPGFRISLPVNDGQTSLSLSYDYTLRYFEDRPKNIDHTHLIDARLSHNFNTRYKLDVFDNFAQAQEPAQLGSGGTAAQVLRAEGTNWRNIAGIDFTGILTERWKVIVGYRNQVFRFDEPLFSVSLDRTVNLPSINLRYILSPKTEVGFLYQYGITDFDGGSNLAAYQRDSKSHFVAATLDHDFSSTLRGSIRGGVQVNEFQKVAGFLDRDNTSPYVDGQLEYTYASGSSLTLGIRHELTPTDFVVAGIDPVRGIAATIGRAAINHSFTQKLVGNLSGLYQHGTFIGGGILNGESDNYASIDANLVYRFTAQLSGRVGYSHDRVDNDIVGDFRRYSRNRVYVGVNFTY